jgi:hypothetical protein
VFHVTNENEQTVLLTELVLYVWNKKYKNLNKQKYWFRGSEKEANMFDIRKCNNSVHPILKLFLKTLNPNQLYY